MKYITAAAASALLFVAAGASAQETPPEEEQPEAVPEEAQPAEAAESTSESVESVETVPVEGGETDEVASAPAEFPYRYAAARYVHAEDGDVTTDGPGLEASWLLLPSFYSIVAFTMAETDAETDAAEISTIELGAGYRYTLMPGLDLNAAYRTLKVNTKTEEKDRDEMGYQFGVGARYMAMDRLETRGELAYRDVYNSGKPLLTVAALYHVFAQLSAGAEITANNDSTGYGLTARWAF